MSLKLAPSVVLSLAALVAALATAGTIYASVSQPWTGLSLLAQGDNVIVASARGPARDIEEGSILLAVAGDGSTIHIEPLDVVAEPDGAMGDYETYRRFLARQEELAQILRAETVDLQLQDGGTFSMTPEQSRPVGSLPVAFWIQLCVGVFAWLIAASVFAYRSTDAAAQFLLLSGLATLTFAPFAGVYSTRELALPGFLFQWLNDLNFLGGSLFSASFAALMLNYPKQIGPRWLGAAVVALFVAWFAAQQLGFFDSMTFARRFLVMIAVFVTFGLAGWHWYASRREPATRAALQWFILSWVAGSGLFALFILLPQMFGVDTSALQGYAFVLFLLVYAGLAFGILRYRLFDLDRWWRGAFLGLLAALVLIGLDFLFLFGLHFSTEVSLALALFISGVIWLPLRGMIWGRLFGVREGEQDPLRFKQITDVALAPLGTDRNAPWQAVVSDAFRPLKIEAYGSDVVRREQEGLALLIPGIDGMEGLRLTYADDGRRLFGPRDEARAQNLIEMLAAAVQSRNAYQDGVQTERARLARDIHDNIGAQLLSALHSDAAERKNLMIGQTLSDLRDIIRDATRPGLPAEEALADLRAETGERLEAAGIKLNWRVEGEGGGILSTETGHTLRSIVRETVTNIIRHARASEVDIDIDHGKSRIGLRIRDNGYGFNPDEPTSGTGLENMRERAKTIGTTLDVSTSPSGTMISATLPLFEMVPAA